MSDTTHELTPAAEQPHEAEPLDTLDALNSPDTLPGTDPGDGETWDIQRLRCPDCDRPIALVGDEYQFPQHAMLPTAWHPFSPALCPGSGRPVDEAEDLEDEPDFDPEPTLEALLALPPELDWRRQPFSHVGGPGSRPVRAHIPAQRQR